MKSDDGAIRARSKDCYVWNQLLGYNLFLYIFWKHGRNISILNLYSLCLSNSNYLDVKNA